MKDYKGSYVTWGPPGCGKTRWLSLQIKAVVNELGPESVVVCSLTRAAAAEIAGRDLPIPRRQVGTLHSMAYRQMDQEPIAELHAKEFNDENPRLAIKTDRVDIDDLGGAPARSLEAGTKAYQEYGLFRAQMKPRKTWRLRVRMFAERWESWKKKHDYVDFGDMISLATDRIATAPGDPEVIILDEGQDMSAAEWVLIRKWSKAAGALIVAGDPMQELYHWRGSDTSIFFDKSIPGDHRKLLSQSYRVPQKIKDASMQWLRSNLMGYHDFDYKARPTKGQIMHSHATWKYPEPLLEKIKKVLRRSSTETVMISATCGYMLGPTIALLKKQGVPISNPWRRKRGDWNPLYPRRGMSIQDKLLEFVRMVCTPAHMLSYGAAAKSLDILKVGGTLQRGAKAFFKEVAKQEPDNIVPADIFFGAFEAQAREQLETFRKYDPNREMSVIKWFLERCMKVNKNSIKYIVRVIENYGLEALKKAPRVFVGTIHSFKGSEADGVIVFPDVSPSGAREWSKRATRNGVTRAFYVALTRAREILTVCAPQSTYTVNLERTVSRFI